MRSSGLVLFACAGLLLSGGAFLGGSAAWGLLRMSYYFWTTELGVELGAGVVLAAGALLCLPACWLATIVPYQPKSTSLTAVLLGLASVALAVLCVGLSAMAALSRAVREPAALNASMQRAMALEPYDPAVRSSFAAMQLELRCCGVHSYNDWYQHRHSLPPACCGRVWNGKRTEQCQLPTYGAGCLRAALAELRYYANSLSALAAALVIVVAVVLFTTSYLAVSSALERSEARHKPPQPLRVACLHAVPPPAAFTSPAVAPPASFTSPAALSAGNALI